MLAVKASFFWRRRLERQQSSWGSRKGTSLVLLKAGLKHERKPLPFQLFSVAHYIYISSIFPLPSYSCFTIQDPTLRGFSPSPPSLNWHVEMMSNFSVPYPPPRAAHQTSALRMAPVWLLLLSPRIVQGLFQNEECGFGDSKVLKETCCLSYSPSRLIFIITLPRFSFKGHTLPLWEYRPQRKTGPEWQTLDNIGCRLDPAMPETHTLNFQLCWSEHSLLFLYLTWIEFLLTSFC